MHLYAISQWLVSLSKASLRAMKTPPGVQLSRIKVVGIGPTDPHCQQYPIRYEHSKNRTILE